ncbi:MAG: FlgD immunoglobulin-like domain containing protein, partial [Candidatus Neomarinimicrobiota bacterium]
VDLKTVVDTVAIKMPSIVSIEPDTIRISESTEVRVRVIDSATSQPIPNVKIFLANWEFDSDSVAARTDTAGLAVFSVTPRFGKKIQITGKRSSDQFVVFTGSLTVTGGNVFQQPDISASVDSIGLFGSLTTDFEGIVSASCGESGITLFVKGCGIDTSVAANFVAVTPKTTGELRAAIAKSGYDIYEEAILVQKVTAQLSGVVQDSGGNGLQGARVTGFCLPDSVDAVFDVTTEQRGSFSVPSELSVGRYLIRAELFGYKLFSERLFLKCDENQATIVMQADSGGWLSGKITETGTNLPLDATIGANRQSDDGWISYTSVVSDDSTGGNYHVHLPYGDYRFEISSRRHISRLMFLSVSQPELTCDVSLDTTRADILIVDDDMGKRTPDEEKILSGEFYEMKSDVVIAEKSPSASEFSRNLTELGYWAVCEKSALTDASTWRNYDLVVWTSGSNTRPIGVDLYRSSLETFIAEGGKLLIEGGEIAWKASSDVTFADFRSNVLRIDAWSKDNSGDLSSMLPAHPVSTMPNSLPSVYNVEYTSFGDQDGCQARSEAQAIYCGSGRTEYAGIIAYDNNEIPVGGQSLFMSVAFDHLGDSLSRKALLENVVSWLISPETLTKGDVNLDGKYDILDVVRTVNFILNIGNSPKSYERFCADVNADSSIDVLDVVRIVRLALGLESLAKPNQTQITRVDLILRGNDLWIQSNGDIAGIQIKLKEPMSGKIELSPAMRESGSLVFRTNTETALFYDTQGKIASAGETRLCTLPENCAVQSVIVSDLLGNPVQAAIRRLPTQFSVSRNYPNPFNSQTTIRYDLPTDASVQMMIYDIRGHKIRTLENGFKPAGYHQAVWNGKDDAGRDVASGIYFFQMISETHRKTMKLMLVK